MMKQDMLIIIQSLHYIFNDLPLVPENKSPPGGKVNKLICEFYDKTNYIVYYEAVKPYKNWGIKIRKVHRGIKFTQTAFMAPYIQFNNEQRQKT